MPEPNTQIETGIGEGFCHGRLSISPDRFDLAPAATIGPVWL